MSRFGSGMNVSSASSNLPMHSLNVGSAGLSSAPLALPRMNGTFSPFAVEAVFRQEITGFQFDQIDQLRVIDEIAFVQEHDEFGDADLPGEQDVFPGLRHRAVHRREQQDGTVHLRRPGNHVLDVIGMAGTVDVGVVPSRRLVLDVAGDDRDRFGRVTLHAAPGDVLVALDFGKPFFRLDRKDGGGQGGLAVIDVTDGPDVDVNLLHDIMLPGCTEQPKGCAAPALNRFCDLFSTTSETRALETTNAERRGWDSATQELVRFSQYLRYNGRIKWTQTLA